MSGDIRSMATLSVIQGGRDGADQGLPFASGGGGPHDPSIEARGALLERGFEEPRASLTRIEASQAEPARELRDFRRDMKEIELPAIKGSMASIDASLEEKPSAKDFLSLAQNFNGTLYRVVGLCPATTIAGVRALSWPRSNGCL